MAYARCMLRSPCNVKPPGQPASQPAAITKGKFFQANAEIEHQFFFCKSKSTVVTLIIKKGAKRESYQDRDVPSVIGNELTAAKSSSIADRIAWTLPKFSNEADKDMQALSQAPFNHAPSCWKHSPGQTNKASCNISSSSILLSLFSFIMDEPDRTVTDRLTKRRDRPMYRQTSWHWSVRPHSRMT